MKHLENLITVYNAAREFDGLPLVDPTEVTGRKLYEIEGWFRTIKYSWGTDWIVHQVLGDGAYVEWLPDDDFKIHKR